MKETATRLRPRYDVARMTADMARRGWSQADLSRAAGVSKGPVSEFLRGVRQTPQMAARLAKALGYSPNRYFSHVEAA